MTTPPDHAPAVVDRRHDAVGVHVEVPFLVIAAERHADILALVRDAAFVGASQHLHDIDRIDPAPDFHHTTPLAISIPRRPCRRRYSRAAWCSADRPVGAIRRRT